MTGKTGEGCIEERVCSSLSIRAGVVITVVGMGGDAQNTLLDTQRLYEKTEKATAIKVCLISL